MSRILLIVLASLAPSLAFGHGGHVETGAFAAGFGHPLGGADHLLAMVAVGLWAGLSGGRAVWALPVTFVTAMLAGAMLGTLGVGLPAVEHTIIASVIVIGAVAALQVRVALPVSAALIALFGMAHGHAHGTEGPAFGFAMYVAGFALATAALHAAGVMLARATLAPISRGFCALTAAGGAALAFM
ncbi:MAG: HupE/UreJ family protein [Gemmobacter sp.]|nr:HupE/UreJ family protein [Gemmobacter sp.]